ncbi:alpha/beta hydrolase [Phytomonospora sp. NPDC050363]|uniref:alpha/beta hydrolase n=1 Tax=Phytomonospora sp. NPDC050363 TaxID=3155642 RepID=UPI0033CBCE2F
MEFARFRDTDVTAFADVARIWRDFAEGLYTLDDTVAPRMVGPLSQARWSGSGSFNARNEVARIRELCESRAMRAEAMADVFEQVHAQVGPIHTELCAVIDGARADGLLVGEDGTVAAPGIAPIDPGTAGPWPSAAVRAGEYGTTIGALLAEVERISAAAAKAATDLAPERPGILAPDEFNDIRDDSHEHSIADDVVWPRENMSPEQARTWWESLSGPDRRAYLLAFPEEVGAMDGLPTLVRDEANRWNLRRDIEVGHDPTGARDMLGRLESRDHLPANQRAYLIDYAPPGPGGAPDARIVASIGDPDKATNTGIYVPGMTTDLPSFSDEGGGFDRTVAMFDAAGGMSADGDTAMVFWLGYDTPDAPDPMSGDPLTAGMRRDAAHEGAPELDRFVDTLNATHDPSIPSHTTVVGHSYGSLVTGVAAASGDGLAVDDIVLVGSPGVGADHADELQVGSDHVWVEAADDDPITAWGNHGTDPAGEDFGARRLLTDTPGHSAYWDEGSTSLMNLGAVIAEDSERKVETPARNEILGLVVE